LAEYTVTSFLYTEYEPHDRPFEMTLSDDDGRLDWNGEDTGSRETATIGGQEFLVVESFVYKITFVNSEGVEATEDMIYSYLDDFGYVMTTTAPDSQFDAGTQITCFIGYQEYGVDFDTFVCFASGTLIDTPTGPCLVEKLRPGEFVTTLDHGPQRVIWTGSSRVPTACQILSPKTRAICIKTDAFGTGQPLRDVYVSAQHRLLISDWRASKWFGTGELFAPATGLIDGVGITRSPPIAQLTWHHILLPQHEVLTTSGLLSESFFPGANGLSAIGNEARQALFEAFPTLRTSPTKYGKTARPCLTKKEAQALRIPPAYGKRAYGPTQETFTDPARAPYQRIAGG